MNIKKVGPKAKCPQNKKKNNNNTPTHLMTMLLKLLVIKSHNLSYLEAGFPGGSPLPTDPAEAPTTVLVDEMLLLSLTCPD